MSDRVEGQSNDVDDSAEAITDETDEPTGRKPWTDEEKAQIRMLFRNLGVILVMVVIALAVATVIGTIIY